MEWFYNLNSLLYKNRLFIYHDTRITKGKSNVTIKIYTMALSKYKIIHLLK